jgi:hypothetical protein
VTIIELLRDVAQGYCEQVVKQAETTAVAASPPPDIRETARAVAQGVLDGIALGLRQRAAQYAAEMKRRSAATVKAFRRSVLVGLRCPRHRARRPRRRLIRRLTLAAGNSDPPGPGQSVSGTRYTVGCLPKPERDPIWLGCGFGYGEGVEQ